LKRSFREASFRCRQAVVKFQKSKFEAQRSFSNHFELQEVLGSGKVSCTFKEASLKLQGRKF
jgi:hypothetical protein